MVAPSLTTVDSLGQEVANFTPPPTACSHSLFLLQNTNALQLWVSHDEMMLPTHPSTDQ